MSKITKNTSLAELGAIVCEELKKNNIDVFLSGGACVSIYTNNKFESFDLDFISFADRTKIKSIMIGLGFTQEKSRLYIHPESSFMVEFPGSAVKIGEETIEEFSELKFKTGTLKLLTPTDCIKDRLAAYYHWNDSQSLDQAVWVATAQPFKIESVKKWSKNEGHSKKFEDFFQLVKKAPE